MEQLESRALLAGDLVISEFLAVNDSGLIDQDGDHSDWIEIHNTTAATINLGGWYLTDNANNKTKWQFPNTPLAADGYLLVFASSKNRAVSGAELHTNFALGATGEYLGLIQPNGTTVEYQYTPSFPEQHPDISYGIGQSVTIDSLLISPAPAKILIPTSNSLGNTWTAEGFNDALWTSGTTGVGYEVSVPGFAVKNFKANVLVDSLAKAEEVIGTPGMQTSVVAETKPVINFLGGGASAHYPGDTGFPGRTVGQDVEDFVIEAKAEITIPSAGFWTFGVNSDDGFSLAISQNGGAPFTVSYPDPRGPADTLATFNFQAAGVYDLRLVMYERGGGDEVELFAAPGALGAWNAVNFDLVGDVANGGLKVESAPVGNASGGYSSLIGADVQTAMYNVNASAYVRIPFNVSDPNAYTALSLRMKYDDGFVAYLNGVEVASRNAPGGLSYNSAATQDRIATLATTFEDISITSFLYLLHPGTNVLAIQALNDSAASMDFLMRPELAQITTVQSAQRFFTQPTPGAVNNSAGVIDFVADTTFNFEHGYYDSAFDLTIATATPGATIRYTTDGSAPSQSNGTVYTGPIHIGSTTTVRAFAYKDGFEPTESETQTYVFLDNVLMQTRPAGYPVSWNAGVGDYDMDPNVVNNPAYAATIKEDLKALPSMSLVMDLADIFGPQGIYSNPVQEGVAWERPGSLEMFNTDGTESFQLNAGVRMYGGVGRYEQFRKHAFRLVFKEEYGPTKLEYPLFPDSAVTKFDTIILRAGFNNSWHRQSAGEEQQAHYIQDQFIRDIQLDMGQPASHGRFVNLYINGLYWGVYNVVERPDASFAAQHLGGDKDNWDALNSSNAIDGDRAAWDALHALINAGVTTQAQYDQVKQYLDVDNLIDYMIVNFYGGNLDWDDHNWYAARERVPGAGFKFFSWDSERTLENVNENRINVGQADKPSAIYAALRNNAEFRLDFADRVYKHLFNDGALTAANAAERFGQRKTEIDRAIVGESARWGDSSRAIAYTRNVEWIAEINRLNNSYFPQRTGILLTQLKAGNLYPAVDAPTMSQAGGNFSGTLALTMTSPVATIYYTLDGSDPRLVGGTIAPGAIAYSGAINLISHTIVNARVRSAGGVWSALNVAEFAPDASKLRVTEVMYNPLPGGGYTSNDLEYVELQNTGPVSIHLKDTRFAAGIDFVFGNVSIAAGERIVLVKNAAAFASRYPGVAIAGVFTGTLDNVGEQLVLQDALGRHVLDFEYQVDWYPITNGQGYSLVIIDPTAAPTTWSSKASWRPSQFAGGNPTLADSGLNPGSIVVNEVLSNTADGVLGDQIELRNTTSAAIDISGWWLSDSALQPAKYRIQPGTIVPAGGYVTFNQLGQFGLVGAPGVTTPFDLNSQGELVYISSADGAGNLAGYREEEDFGAAEAEVSFGLYTKSTGGTDFVAQSASSFDSDNAYPKVGPIVINEVMYHPLPGGDEFIELLNITGSDVPLFDPANPAHSWQFTRGVTFAFPTGASGVTLTAGGYALVVGIDPATFRTKYTIPAEVPILGPYVGLLDNAGETLELSKPGVPTAPGVFPLIAVDKVAYQPDAPWSTAPDGHGPALFRFEPAEYGNDVINWQPSTTGGTPGELNVGQDSTPPSVPTGLTPTVVSTTRIDLVWNVSADPHSGVDHYRVFRGGIEIGVPSTPSFSDTTAVAGVSYTYEVSAVNGDGFESAKGTPVVTTILGLTSVNTTDATHVQVKFTGTVQPASATNTANYTIAGATISGASLGGDGRTVTLTTSTLIEDTTYTLTVNNVTSTSGTVVPAGTERNFIAGQGVGLRGEYYDNIDYSGTLLVRTDPTVDFGWGGGSPAPSMGADSFSVRWTGLVRPLYTETYTFYTVSDDGVRLWVNGQQIINNYTDHGDTENSGTIALVAGERYTIRMEFYENGGGATARLLWSSPTQAKQTIPQAQLFLPPDVSIGDVALSEGNSGTKNFVFTVNLTTRSSQNVTVNYATGNLTAVAPTDFTATSGTVTFTPGQTSRTITVSVKGDTTAEINETFALNLSLPVNATLGDNQAIGTILDDDSATVAGRRVFYNNSMFDGNSGAAGASDDGAIAADKSPLLPGGTATFANYTSYSRGINGLMIDVNGLTGTPTAADFTFRVGNNNTPSGWAAGPAPQSVTVRPGAGVGGSARMTLTWADGAILNQWLQVTVKAGGGVGLAAPDVFYFGNAIGETGGFANALVNSTDEIAARGNARTFANLATIDVVHDFNRDGFVNATDQILARSNATTLATALNLISVPSSLSGSLANGSSSPDTIAALVAAPAPTAALPALVANASADALPAQLLAAKPAPAAQGVAVDSVLAAWDGDTGIGRSDDDSADTEELVLQLTGGVDAGLD